MNNPKIKHVRTCCACKKCTEHCFEKPGYTLPGEIKIIASYLGRTDVEEFTEEHFMASRKTRVLIGDRQYVVPTLSPKLMDGKCVFLDDNGRCTIHPVSPYGCAYFDHHQDFETANQRVRDGINFLMYSMQCTDEGREYLSTWDAISDFVVI